jgi:hypothetical protein
VNLLFLDSTGGAQTGPGSPAYFSRFAITHLRSLGHGVAIRREFDPAIVQAADVVICEWANEIAYTAAASGLCKRLIVRMRGFDAHGPLDQLKSYVENRFPGLRDFRSHVIPSGVDAANIPYRERKPGPVVAMVGRAVELKGYQLAMEWARQRPDIQLYVGMAFGETNPRLVEYLAHVRPENVTMHGPVDTVKWLDEIDANYLLSASIWETLGYTIAEAMAMGIKPLIHDTVGAELNWPNIGRWDSLSLLDMMVGGPPSYGSAHYASEVYRHFVEEHLDAYRQSAKFADLVLAPATRTVRTHDTAREALNNAGHALASRNLDVADQAVTAFRAVASATPDFVDFRVGFALQLAGLYYAADRLPEARTWALRSMADEARPDAMCLLGEIALAEDDLEGAERWYVAAEHLRPVPSRFGDRTLIDGAQSRLVEIEQQLNPLWEGDMLPEPVRFLIVVAVRNAEKYIARCLDSVKAQDDYNYHCIVVDDASTDGTGRVIAEITDALKKTMDARFTVGWMVRRQHSLSNIVEAIRTYGKPEDVVVILDGDDELLPDALENISIAYRSGAWLTYGNFTTSSGKPSWMPPYPQKVLRASAVRDYPWRVSHPKTFKIELFNHLTDEDFTHEGKWFETAGDVALMIPMLEMAAERSVYIPESIYVWNDENPESDHRVDPDGQVRVRDLILSKPAKKRLEEL